MRSSTYTYVRMYVHTYVRMYKIYMYIYIYILKYVCVYYARYIIYYQMGTSHYSPDPMPPTTPGSLPPIIPDPTTEGVGGPCGAILGRYRQPKPSAFMSNSMNAGVIDAPWRRTSLGVVMETRHLTLVRGTVPPLAVPFFISDSTCGFSKAYVGPEGSEEWRASKVSSFSEAQHNGAPSRRKFLRQQIRTVLKLFILFCVLYMKVPAQSSSDDIKTFLRDFTT